MDEEKSLDDQTMKDVPGGMESGEDYHAFVLANCYHCSHNSTYDCPYNNSAYVAFVELGRDPNAVCEKRVSL